MVIDFHGHVGSIDRCGMRDRVDTMLRAMDLGGVDISCVFNIGHTRASVGNDATAKFVAAHPDRFIGFAFVTPHYPEEMQKELERAIDQLGLKGIKIYPPYYTDTVENPVWEPIFAFAHAKKLPIISHTDGAGPIVNPNHGEPQMFVPWAQKYTNAKVVLAHAGNFRSGRQSCIRAAQRCANIYIEICTSWRNFHSIEDLVQGAGEDRILFGSDIPLMDPRIQMGRVVTARISEQAKQKVLGENAARILGLSRAA